MGVDPDMVAHYVAPKPRSDAERDDTALHEAIKLLVEASGPPTQAALNYFMGRGIGPAYVKEAVNRELIVTLPADIEEAKSTSSMLSARSASMRLAFGALIRRLRRPRFAR